MFDTLPSFSSHSEQLDAQKQRSWKGVCQTILFYTFLFLVYCSSSLLFCLEYEAAITETSKKHLPHDIIEGSQLLSNQNLPIPSIPSLRGIVEQDKEEMLTRAKAFGYLDATIKTECLEKEDKFSIHFFIDMGKQYRLGTAGFYLLDPTACRSEPPSLKDIPSFTPNAFFTLHEITSFEHELIYSLLCRGYPRAILKETVLEADTSTGRLNLFFKIDLGPFTTFGPITVQGTQKIDPSYLLSRIGIQEGSIYKKNELDETESTLLQTGLLQSASFDSSLPIQPNGTLPLELHVQEAKTQTVGTGLSYMTTVGPGVSCLYENRYFSMTGQKLSLRADLMQKKQQGIVSLTSPSFKRENQNLIWLLEYENQTYLPYHSSSLSLSCLLEKQLSKCVQTVCGVQLEKITSTHTSADKHNELFKVPLQLKWNNSNSLFDPTKGASLNIRLTPSTQYIKPTFSYLIQQTTGCCYTSFLEDKLTLAMKGVLGNVLGGSKNKIPIPDRFFGGSDTLIRGYKVGTISPRDKQGIFIGGDSLLAGSFELRTRQKKEALGWVLFYDVGEVYRKRYPDKFTHLFHSVGVGVRYTTPIGPLRLDVAFPLNRRKGIDPLVQLYFSVGQAF